MAKVLLLEPEVDREPEMDREPDFVARGRFSECKRMWPVQSCHRFFFPKLRGTRTKKQKYFLDL